MDIEASEIDVIPSDRENMRTFIPKSWVNLATASIILLVILNIFITRRNNKIIEENKLLQQQTEQIKVTVSQFAIIIIHNLDLGLRGYALFGQDKYLFPMKFALRDKDSLFYSVHRSEEHTSELQSHLNLVCRL